MKKSLGANTILYPTPVWVIGSYDKDGKADVMTAAWAGICCSNPPSVAVSVQEVRQTFGNITSKGAFTVSVPSGKHVREADYFGIVSGKREDKFDVSGLTPVKSDVVDAPYVGEFPLVAECRLSHTLKVGVHTIFVGEILDVKCDEEMLNEDGALDVEKLGTFLFDPPGHRYYSTGKYLEEAFSCGRKVKKS